MITNIKNIKIFPNGELPNDDYHGEAFADHVSGSQLCVIHNDCPAVLKYGENKESAALHFGIASHAAMLEPEMFDELFVRKIAKEDNDKYLTSDAAIKSFLKSAGVTGYSTKAWPELVIMALKCDANVKIFQLESILQEYDSIGKTLVRGEDYDQILIMRSTLFNDKSNAELFKDAQFEMSIVCEIEIDNIWHKIKIRPDIITRNCEVPDYKTTRDMCPEKFGNQAHNAGYWLKQAFVGDVLAAAYNQSFKMGLLAQGKSSPFITQLYWMTEQQLQIGREQYQFALKQHKICVDNDSWPAYFDGAVELVTPIYLAKRYGFESDEIEIKFEE
tara:strand:+ start:1918 stop:2910 length:993 start_codon:yes stop_codon:yes gene_type:complete